MQNKLGVETNDNGYRPHISCDPYNLSPRYSMREGKDRAAMSEFFRKCCMGLTFFLQAYVDTCILSLSCRNVFKNHNISYVGISEKNVHMYLIHTY